jgi:hypothetical protein
MALECDTPRDVEGRRWGVLKKEKCLEGNVQYYGDYSSTSYIVTDTDHKYFTTMMLSF